jgi:enoyl-CoA hydratase/carnithine racemase
MSRFEEYAQKYSTIQMERRDGILQITFHTGGGPLEWGERPHAEFARAFADIGDDPENKVVIMTGTGDVFSGPRATPATRWRFSARRWATTHREGQQLLRNLLEIEAPMISAINGPALRHSELPLLCDIVLAAEAAEFQDSGHFANDMVPGDGMHIVYPLILGMNRGRYFLLTGQVLSARQALEMGIVNEVLPRDKLLPRAWELADEIARRSPLVRRFTRVLLTRHITRMLDDLLGYGLALEGLGVVDTATEAE